MSESSIDEHVVLKVQRPEAVAESSDTVELDNSQNATIIEALHSIDWIRAMCQRLVDTDESVSDLVRAVANNENNISVSSTNEVEKFSSNLYAELSKSRGFWAVLIKQRAMECDSQIVTMSKSLLADDETVEIEYGETELFSVLDLKPLIQKMNEEGPSLFKSSVSYLLNCVYYNHHKYATLLSIKINRLLNLPLFFSVTIDKKTTDAEKCIRLGPTLSGHTAKYIRYKNILTPQSEDSQTIMYTRID